jgi:hypothetical protein
MTAIQTHIESLKVGSGVGYLNVAWTITRIVMPPDLDSHRYAILERINPMGAHELVEVAGDAWHLIVSL